MPLTTIPIPYGLRDVKIAPLTGDTPGTFVDLPYAQTFSFVEAEDFTTLRGDDRDVAVHGAGPALNWSLAAGGISLEAYAIITGGAVTESGVTPNQIKTFAKEGSDQRPYFQVKGQVISDSGGDVHAVVYKCKAEGDVGGEFGDAAFYVTNCTGRGIPNGTDKLYDIIQHETITNI